MSSPSVVPDKPIELTLGDGSVVKGANLDEAFKNLATMKENASAAIRQTKTELEAEQQRRAQLEQELERYKHPPQNNDNGKFNNEKYYQMLNTDPIGAQNYLDAHRFGISEPEQVPATFNQMRQQVDNFTQQTVTASFLAQHAEDFPPTPEAAKALTAKVQSLVQNGVPFNADTLNYAYYELVQNGTIKPNEAKTEEEETPNPSLGGGGSPALPSDVARAEQLDDKQLEALLRSKGVLR